ncbi:MAG: hypothetical protein EOM19_03715 [Candidatus Moranbacteria bacterium]|nr:hypothetical protein [Candidatus Moranbacteria bacterium]
MHLFEKTVYNVTLPLTFGFVLLTFHFATSLMVGKTETFTSPLWVDFFIGSILFLGLLCASIFVEALLILFYEWFQEKTNSLITEILLGGIYLLWGFTLFRGFLTLS